MKRYNGLGPISWGLVEGELGVTRRTVNKYRSDMYLDEETCPKCTRKLLARLQLMSIFTSLSRERRFSRKSFVTLEGDIEELERLFREKGVLQSPASPAFTEMSVQQLLKFAYCEEDEPSARQAEWIEVEYIEVENASYGCRPKVEV